MARPKKEGLDYFPLDVDMDQDDKIALVEAKHGITGFAVILKLFMKIYKEGYFYKWEEKEQLLFSNRINVKVNLMREIVRDCINFGLFDKEIYEKYNVLTSKGIQERYLEAISRRKSVFFIAEYLLVSIEDSRLKKIEIEKINVDNNGVNVDINPQSLGVNVDINGVNVGINPQSKVKESKVKESKVKDREKNDENILLKIKNFRLRYSENQLKIIDNYLEMIRHTRTSARITDSVAMKMYEQWDKHPTVCVEYGLKIHTDTISLHSKKESYTLGIIRNTTADQAVENLSQSNTFNTGPNKKSNVFSFTDLVEKGAL